MNVMKEQKVCPACGYRFKGNGWDGIDSHWRFRHEHLMPYEKAWPLVRNDLWDNADGDKAERLP